VHAFGWANLRAQRDQPDSAPVVPELITSSISSNPVAQNVMDGWTKDSPELRRIDGTKRGYIDLKLTPARVEAAHVGVSNQRDSKSACTVVRTLAVEAGRPTVVE